MKIMFMLIYQYNYVNNSYVSSGISIKPNFIGIRTDNVNLYSTDDINLVVSNPKNGDIWVNV